MKKINRWLIFLLCVPTVAFAQQNSLLQKYRSMALDYNHDLKAADKNIAASIELEKAAQKDLRPKLSGDRKSTRLNSSHSGESRMPSSA